MPAIETGYQSECRRHDRKNRPQFCRTFGALIFLCIFFAGVPRYALHRLPGNCRSFGTIINIQSLPFRLLSFAFSQKKDSQKLSFSNHIILSLKIS
jgi:hypothetical protein